MSKSEVQKRWRDDGFMRAIAPIVRRALVDKQAVQDIDIRGITVGLDGAVDEYVNLDFQAVNLSGLAADWSKFSCSFGGAQIAVSSFTNALFDTCRFKSARFTKCEFTGARFASPYWDDAVFDNCDFTEAAVTGRGTREYGGRRVLFEDCCFDGVVFQNLQFRATAFRNCSFDGTMFKKCYLAGIKFEGSAIDDRHLQSSETQSLSFDGRDLVL